MAVSFEGLKPEDTKKTLDLLTREIMGVKSQIKAEHQMIETLEKIALENKEFIGRITEAKKTMFLLIHEKVQVATAAHVEDYLGLLERDWSALENTDKKKKEEGK